LRCGRGTGPHMSRPCKRGRPAEGRRALSGFSPSAWTRLWWSI
jgi:hypothetical protein